MANAIIRQQASGGNDSLTYEIIDSWTSVNITSINITLTKNYKGLIIQLAQDSGQSGSSPRWNDLKIDNVVPTSNYYFLQGGYYEPYTGNMGASYSYLAPLNIGQVITATGARMNKGLIIGIL